MYECLAKGSSTKQNTPAACISPPRHHRWCMNLPVHAKAICFHEILVHAVHLHEKAWRLLGQEEPQSLNCSWHIMVIFLKLTDAAQHGSLEVQSSYGVLAALPL